MKKNKSLIVKIIFVVLFLLAWELYAIKRDVMAFPRLEVILQTLWQDLFFKSPRPILKYLGKSLLLITEGLGIGVVLSFLFSGLSVASETFSAIFQLVVSVCDLLPAVALMPILMITLGATETTIVILVVHSVVWPMSRNMADGFQSVPAVYLESGKNIGLSRWGLVTGVYIPSSFANIISGLRVGWARAWRGLISAEMIFGVASSAGIGTYINNARTLWLSFPSVYGFCCPKL